MPASKQNPAAPTPASPRNTAKYTNKDGSKFITVPKATPSDSSQPSTPTATARPGDAPLIFDPPAPSVNRKKQKRRQKAAAKAAAELAANGHNSPAPAPPRQPPLESDEQEAIASEDDAEDAEIHGHDSYPTVMNGHSALPAAKSKKNKKKKKATMAVSADQTPPALTTMTKDSPISVPAASRGPGMSRDKIWSTSNHEERERIKEFWLGLGEEERKSLVKVEKDAVLKKMKEQQKHTCSCTVCGRKRTAIEEELEGLYDAYYLELEQFANQGEGPPMLSPPPRDFPLRPPRRLPSRYAARPPSRRRIVEHVGDEEELEEAYSEDEVDDEFSDDEPPEEFQNVQDRDVADFLTFGNSLQVKGGILTVADDLLKNDGKRFIEMMEQLAERRMAREEDARDHFSRAFSHPDGSYSNPHNHSPPDEDEYEEEDEDEDDYEDSQEEEYDEEDQMTEEQRMEEGRRMFQIFAARMFEQRVLSAYKEKVAKERQQKLLEELEEESRQVDEQKAKKAKNAQKKKDKAAQKKQALAEDKARREASKAADEAARLEAEQKRAAEQRQKAEEKRKQKEAQRKAEEDARLKKEAERQRRIYEQQEKQAEQERKARELKERDKRLKEEQRIREKEAREQRERGAQERKDKQERDKREKEARAAVKARKEAHEAAPSRERGRDEKTAHKAGGNQHGHGLLPLAPKRGHAGHHPVSIPTVLPQHPSNPAAYASPKVPVATLVIPKAPTPIRPRTMSQQQQPTPPPPSSSPSQQPQPPRPPQPPWPPLELGHGQASSAAAPPTASRTSQNPSPRSATAAYASHGPVRQERKASLGGLPMASQPYPTQPLSPHTGQPKPPAGQPAVGFQMPPMGMQAPPGLGQQRPPGFGGPMAHDGMLPLGFRPGPKVMAPPPGINGPAGRGFPPGPLPPPGFPQGASGGDQFPLAQGFGLAKEAPAAAHVRQHSTAGYDGTNGMASQPIGRPAPIGRPCSISQGNMRDSDDDAKRLGSRVLVEDDEPLSADLSLAGLRNQPPGPRGGGFETSPFMDSGFPMGHGPWGPPGTASQPFQPPGFGNTAWASPTIPPGFSVGSPAPTSGMGSLRTSAQPRHVALRLMLCQACKDLASTSGDKADGFVELGAVRAQIESQTGDATIVEPDLLNLCDTEGNGSNGGGVFEVRHDASGLAKCWIRWVPDALEGCNHPFRAVGAPGEIGSPLTSHASIRGI